MTSLLFFLFLAGLGWFWFDSLRAHEIAKGMSKKLCQHYQLQLLDDTISLKRLTLHRDRTHPKLRFYLQRAYHFEFTADGAGRTQGQLLMKGTRPVFIDLPGYYERVIV